MDKYTIFDQSSSATAGATALAERPRTATAQSDLDAALHLLAARAQYLTAAMGAAISLLEDDAMICRAAVGRASLEIGAEIETGSGLIAEAIQARQLVRCENAGEDPRANREACREMGAQAVMVMPLVLDHQAVGVFELISDRLSAFEERDAATLQRLAEMALTAIAYADAAARELPQLAEIEPEPAAAELPLSSAPDSLEEPPSEAPESPVPVETMQIGSCASCGFPISQGRRLCVDCERVDRAFEDQSPKRAPLSELAALGGQESWFQAHSYTIGALAVAAFTLVLLAIKFR